MSTPPSAPAHPTFAEPVVAWHRPDDPERPLVVLLHGRGADEQGIIGLADHLPAGPSYAAVRAPIAEGDADTVIPRELLDRTWSYLTGESGAPPYARRDPGGHGLTAATVGELGGWIGERLDLLARRHPAGPRDGDGLRAPRSSRSSPAS